MNTKTNSSRHGLTGTEAFARAKSVRVVGRTVQLTLEDGRRLSFDSGRYPRLASAAPAQLRAVELDVDGEALRWEQCDEDILVQDVVEGRFPKPRGGQRAGAGRKPSGRKPVLVRLKVDVINRLRAKAAREGRTLSEIAEQALAKV